MAPDGTCASAAAEAAGALPIAGDTDTMFLIRHGQSEFNVAFAQTRTDPGIVDPGLTDLAAPRLSPRQLSSPSADWSG